ncbi:MAG: zinc ABC transporter substrate-binding protein [Lachnospiraceae bacterium]|nr:zinc ABC transporter substrate-binding protein [Lachnospiraceae bacterium]
MKRVLLVISLIVTFVLVSACGKKVTTENASASTDSKKIKIVTTIYPEYDWVSNIIKGKEEKFDLSILMTSGVDLHNFQPSAKDILDIGTADLFIYVGGESDKWADGAIRQAANKNLKSINLMELLKDKVKVEELKEGMEDDEHHHDEEEGEEHEGEEEHHEEEIEYDEHVWLSLENAMIVCADLKNEIVSLDSENATVYEKNLQAYVSELKNLNEEYKNVVNSAKRKVLLFADRFPFRYMVDDYDLNYFAAFKGCAAETEASFKTIKFLADKLGEENLPYVMKIERSDDKIARAVIENSSKKDATIETMYSIQAVSSDDIKRGETYLSYMKKNLEVLKKVLN